MRDTEHFLQSVAKIASGDLVYISLFAVKPGEIKYFIIYHIVGKRFDSEV